MNNSSMMTRLLSFTAGFVDTIGFLGLQGLFAAHVTGNFVTLAAAFVYGAHGTIGKILALPEFIGVVALVRLASTALSARGKPTLTILLCAEAVLLAIFLAFGVTFGPFLNSDVAPALAAGFAGVSAMALQNAMQRIHFAGEPPTAIMTVNVTQAVLDGVDLLRRVEGPEVRARFLRLVRGISWFAAGCAIAAVLYYLFLFWSLALPVAIAIGLVVARMREARAVQR